MYTLTMKLTVTQRLKLTEAYTLGDDDLSITEACVMRVHHQFVGAWMGVYRMEWRSSQRKDIRGHRWSLVYRVLYGL